MQNYHKHSCWSDPISRGDSAVFQEDYAKRAVELGHKVLSSVEHGWQGYYFETFELAQKYGLKFVFGAEAYWVLDRHQQDRTNCHMIILAKTEKGRQAINEMLSTANEDGYYYRPRIDLELLKSLPPQDVVITTACIAGWYYGFEKSEEIFLELFKIFGSNFFLEIQYHNIPLQIETNQHILQMHEKYGIPMIVALDSHYIDPSQAVERDELLKSNGIFYEDEQGMFLDYPSDDEVKRRFAEQGVFTPQQVQEAMDNTDICLTFEDYAKDNPIFSSDIKIPSIFPDKTQEEKNSIYRKLITRQFKKFMQSVPKERYQEYWQAVKNEVDTYIDTNLVDYPLMDYAIVEKAKQMGGMITTTGRGSAASYLTNTLCGFSQVDRLNSPIKLYPDRFISKTRILETHSLPDLDLNLGNVEIFAQAQEEILGKDHAIPMIAFGTAKKKSAFKIYARAKDMDFTLANTISRQIEKYDKAVANAEEDEKDEIDIYDYVDEQYRPYIEASKKYWGIITDRKKAPCAYLLYQGSIRKEIGLIKCKSESTKKEYMVAVIDGAIAEHYKFLKNDLLKVDVVLLIESIFKRLGQEVFNVEELRKTVANDPAVWDIYAKGLTIGVNQCEKPATMEKLKHYKPHNVSELAAFIAAIRPGFKSMYRRFESREPFSYGIPALDNLIQTKEIKDSYILFQENLMTILNYASFAMSETYQAVKDIAKKKASKVKALKDKFEEGCTKQIILDEHVSESEAEEISARIWRIINDSSSYLFNACLSGDTVIKMRKCPKGKKIEDLYRRSRDLDWCIKNKRKRMYYIFQDLGFCGYGYSMKSDEQYTCSKNRILDIRQAGIRDTYRMTLESGIDVVATMNHKFPTPDGEKQLSDLKVGDKIYVCDKNLITHLEKIWSIEFEKKQMTYDVEMEAPYHNFVLQNGMVVSNSHAYCMALDSLYCAYLKAHYPYEFYEVLLQFYSDKGNKDKVALIKHEMKAFGISEGRYKFGIDNRRFRADPEHHQIIPSLFSIKSLSQKCANVMYELGQKNFSDFFHLYTEAQSKGVNSRQLDILINIDYFSDFGTQKQLDLQVKMLELFGWKEQKSIKLNLVPDFLLDTVRKYTDENGNFLIDPSYNVEAIRQERDQALAQKITDMRGEFKTKKAAQEAIRANLDNQQVTQYLELKALYEKRINEVQLKAAESQKLKGFLCLLEVGQKINSTVGEYSVIEKIQKEFNCLGYLSSDYSKIKPQYGIVSNVDDKYATRKVTIYRICDGETTTYKIFSRTWESLPLAEKDIVRILESKQDCKRIKDEAGSWVPTKEMEWILQRYDRFENIFSKTS